MSSSPIRSEGSNDTGAPAGAGNASGGSGGGENLKGGGSGGGPKPSGGPDAALGLGCTLALGLGCALALAAAAPVARTLGLGPSMRCFKPLVPLTCIWARGTLESTRQYQLYIPCETNHSHLSSMMAISGLESSDVATSTWRSQLKAPQLDWSNPETSRLV